MATISPVKLCPFCDAELSDPAATVCSSCRSPLNTRENAPGGFFETPAYLFFQKEDHVKGLEREKIQPGAPAHMLRLTQIGEELESFMRKAPPDELLAAMFDAHLVVTHALHTRVTPEALAKIVATAKAIGAIGEGIERYIKSGGSIYERGKAGPLPAARGGYSGSATAADEGGSRF